MFIHKNDCKIKREKKKKKNEGKKEKADGTEKKTFKVLEKKKVNTTTGGCLAVASA